MALKHKIFSDVVWHNIWDPSVSKNWIEFKLESYNKKWPNIDAEDVPYSDDPDSPISTFTLSSLPYIILEKIDSMEGSKKLKMACEYGIKDWTGLYDESGKEVKPSFVKDENGLNKLSQQSWEFLSFFGFPDLSLGAILAIQVLKISRSMQR